MVTAHLNRVFEIQKMISDVHPCLEHVYPIAIAEDNELTIYEADRISGTYQLVSRIQASMQLPKKVRAAFPIEGYGGKMACVVTNDVFLSPTGYATIFHEFVHCYQFVECELDLRRSLRIAREAQAKGDFAWELNYPFPYDDPRFSSLYSALLQALAGRDHSEVGRCRAMLKEELDLGAFEYMVWQEWKEGFARFIENSIRDRLDLPQNAGGNSLPLKRTVFYFGGAKLIEYLMDSDPGVTVDLRELFFRLTNL